MLENYPEVEALRQELAQAKETFRGQILENDVLFDLIKKTLGGDGVDDITSDLPAFTLQPFQQPKPDGKVSFGIAIEQSGTGSSEDLDEIGFGMKSRSYLPIVDIGGAGGNPHAELEGVFSDELRAMGEFERLEAAAQHYLTTYRHLTGSLSDRARVAVDPNSYTFVLLDDLPNYSLPDDAQPVS